MVLAQFMQLLIPQLVQLKLVLLKKYPNSQAVQEVMLRQVMQPSGQGVQVLFSTNMFLVQFRHTNWLPVTMQDTQKFTDNEH